MVCSIGYILYVTGYIIPPSHRLCGLPQGRDLGERPFREQGECVFNYDNMILILLLLLSLIIIIISSYHVYTLT